MKLIEIIGRGANGVVYRGHDRLLDRAVAVKFLHSLERSGSLAQQRFLDEARAGAGVHHPNLVEIYQAGVAGRTPFLILQCIHGQTLAQVIRAKGGLPVSTVAAILEETATAVDELHRRGIIHRDLKPSNILLDSDGHVHVSDLGLCVRRQEAGSAHAPIAGTPAYMAPELFEGRASPRGDIYALGITLFELLAGQLPFTGNVDELRNKHHGEPLPLRFLVERGMQPGLIDVIERASHKRPRFRYKSPQDLARAFIEAAGPSINLTKARLELAMLSARGSGELVSAEQEVKPTIEGSTASTLASFAEMKRQRQKAAASAIALPTAALRQSTLELGVPCAACGYDLQGLPADGKCPECGLPIEKSLDPTRIVFADQTWLDKLTVGYGLIFVWLGLCLAAMLLNTAAHWPHMESLKSAMLHTYYEPSLGLSVELNDAAFGLETAVCLLPLTLGIWLITRPRRNWRSGARYLCRSVVIGTLGLAILLASLALFHVSLHGWIVVPGLALQWQVPRRFGFGSVLAMLEVTSVVLLLWYFGILTRSIPEPQTERRIRRLAMVLLSASIVVMAALNPAVLPLPVTGAGQSHLWTTIRLMVVSKLQAMIFLAGWALFIACILRTARLVFRLSGRMTTKPPPPAGIPCGGRPSGP